MITGQLQPTCEQQDIVTACAAGSDLVIEAGAGTGKTSTLRLAAQAMAGQRGLYLAFTRSTADGARAVFPRQVDCVTAHALAYRAIGWQYAARLRGRASRMPAWAVAAELGIGQPLPLGDRLLLTPAHQARIVLGTIERFCYSADDSISGAHIPPVNGVDPASFAELTWRIFPLAERAWHDIRRPGGTLPFRHDHYLKLWQLTQPRLFTDYIMFDEAQDANPVIVAVIQGQQMQKIAVGDSCQAIYGWRGAVDALAAWPAGTRLYLSRSFRFGPAVAVEANKWLCVLGAPFLLSGDTRIASAVGPVDAPHAIVCRTNAEALVQARAALDAGRRVALAGGGQEIRQLALAALELQGSGRTAHPELAAFRSWGSVRDFVRTDTAGADLAASVRLIDKHGPDTVLATVGRLSGQRRADLVVSTVHRAKGLEWDSVQVAGDFRAAVDDRPVERDEAMLAYVAVTRARTGLDQTGLAWIDNHIGRAGASGASGVAVSDTREITMRITGFDVGFDDDVPDRLLDADPDEAARPYPGGRAQAESGSRIIQNDYYAWVMAALGCDALTQDDPRFLQLGEAWRGTEKNGLSDDPGAASIRYLVLAHAAGALRVPGQDDGRRAAGALGTLRLHALIHRWRLYATSIELFARSPKSGAYSGRGEASAGSRIVASDYRQWCRTRASRDPGLAERVGQLREVWAGVERIGLADGAAAAAGRYRAVSGVARGLGEVFDSGLPSAALGPLLTLALHADKHAIRLHNTAVAEAGSGDDVVRRAGARRDRSRMAGGRAGAYRDLPDQVALAAARSRAETPRSSRSTSASADDRSARVVRQRSARSQRADLSSGARPWSPGAACAAVAMLQGAVIRHAVQTPTDAMRSLPSLSLLIRSKAGICCATGLSSLTTPAPLSTARQSRRTEPRLIPVRSQVICQRAEPPCEPDVTGH